mgnify:CR=1 FL=1
MIVVNQNQRKRNRVKMGLLHIDRDHQRNNLHSLSMEVSLPIEVRVMSFLRDTINCYNNNRPLSVNDQITFKLVNI